MSWIEKLAETYERCYGAPQFTTDPLPPLCHVTQNAHIEIVIDGDGRFRSARVLQRDERPTLIPCTEDSASRANDDAPHPLCDKIQYCASDYGPRGGSKKARWGSFMEQLKEWCTSPHAHPKAAAVLKYLCTGKLLEDLAREGVVVLDAQGQLLKTWDSRGPAPALFKLLQPKEGGRDQGDALLRWRVRVPGDPVSAVWEDTELHACWVRFCASHEAKHGLDHVTGKANVPLATKHPRGIRWPGDSAKLISSNDTEGYTFRGRFESAPEVCNVGFDVSQKAHAALRWLIRRQGNADRKRDQAVVAWATGGGEVPDPLRNTFELLGTGLVSPEGEVGHQAHAGDAGEYLARQLNKYINGYRAKLGATDGVMVMALGSATRGRMAITYYRELTGSEFLDRVRAWHETHAWPQRYPRKIRFIGAPSPREIAEAAYGPGLGEKVRNATVERLLPCVVDGLSVPRDIIESTTRRASNRMGWERWEWEKVLGVACGLFRGYHKEEGYQMSLEEERRTRDYLFGRLLAVGDHVEETALYVARETGRETNAARLMQRFAERPCSTWRTIELSLAPYRARLRARRPKVLVKTERLLDRIISKFQEGDFTDDRKLSGEFLLGYHCQRAALWPDAIGAPGLDGGATEEQEG